MPVISVVGQKGGIGKSTISTSASLIMARMDKRVLHVGCDPKHDSSLHIGQVSSQLLPVKGQKRQDHAKTEQVDKDGQEDDKKGSLAHQLTLVLERECPVTSRPESACRRQWAG